jgi:hypothetical protein
LAAGGLWLRNADMGAVPAVAVMLDAARGAETPHAAPASPLDLRPDLSGLPPFDRYPIEIVDAQGGNRWEGELIASVGTVRAPGRSAGTWFVRVYSPSRELLREYGLRIGN